jgi:hypothetical protein
MSEDSDNRKERKPILDTADLPVEAALGGVYRNYANIVTLDWTLTDVQLRFSALMFRPDPENPINSKQRGVIEERACILLPWHQAKILRDFLRDVVAAYENVNGELRPITLPNL